MALSFGFTAEEILQDNIVEQSDISKLKLWISTQKGIPNLTDEQIIGFILSCNKNQELAQKTITAYYSIKRKVPQFFSNRDVDRKDILRVFQCTA